MKGDIYISFFLYLYYGKYYFTTINSFFYYADFVIDYYGFHVYENKQDE